MRANRVKSPVCGKRAVARILREQRSGNAQAKREPPKMLHKARRWHNWLLEKYPF